MFALVHTRFPFQNSVSSGFTHRAYTLTPVAIKSSELRFRVNPYLVQMQADTCIFSVGILTRVRAGRQRNRGCIIVRSKTYSVFQRWIQEFPSLLSNSYCSQSGRSKNFNTHFDLLSRLRMREITQSLPFRLDGWLPH